MASVQALGPSPDPVHMQQALYCVVISLARIF